MQANPQWGALGFLTKQSESPTTGPIASTKSETARSSDAEHRLELAKRLPHTAAGYEKAAELGCWLSKSKKGGAMLIESMDTAYIANCMRMIADGRHPHVSLGTELSMTWADLFKSEIEKREREESA